MRKTILMGAAMWMASNLAFAGGYLTNTNQHISFLRMIARGASTEIDAVYFNPAGLAFLEKEGLTLSLNIQNAAQERNIDARYKDADVNLYDEVAGKTPMNRWDVGLGAILGYELDNGIQLNAGYQFGFLNQLDALKDVAKMRTQAVCVGVGYRF